MIGARRSREAGFALPLAIFFMAILTLMITAAFSKVQSDRRVADSSGAAVNAFSVAQSGLQTYMGTVAARPANGDSTRVNVSGGYADVVANVVYQPVDTMAIEVYIVRSTGHVIDPTQGADPQASRTLAQFAQWQTGRLSYEAVLVAGNGTANYDPATNGPVTISVADSAGCGGPAVLGIRLPMQTANAPPGVTSKLEDNNPHPWDQSVIGVNWPSIVGGSFQADYTTLTDPNSWASYYINGSYTLTTSGSGLLMVRDSLVISGGTVNWAGIILVGGNIVFSATDTRISGVVVSGLTNQNGNWSTDTRFGGSNTALTIQHNSCNVRHALESVTGFVPISNAWVDNWATY